MKFICSPLGRATMNSLMNVATLLFEITSHSYSLMSRTEAGTLMSRSFFTLTWQASRQSSFISLRVKCTASVGSISPPPAVTCTLHCPQLPLPPQAEGRKTSLVAMAESRGTPEATSTFLSLLIVTVTLPELTRYFLATRRMTTSSRVITRKMPTPPSTVGQRVDCSDIIVVVSNCSE